jgi:hypothetical protein
VTEGTVLVLGIPSEPPVAAVLPELSRQRIPHVMVDQRQLVSGGALSWWNDGAAGGQVYTDGRAVSLDEVVGVYTRMVSWAELPEVRGDPLGLELVQATHRAIEGWLGVTPACVVNRTVANDSNNSKPYQALLIREYFASPETMVTNDPERAREFLAEHGEVVFKSISGERSIVTSFRDDDLQRLDRLANGPVQFQEKVNGFDVRVHVVGGEVFATRVESDGVDYRYDAEGAQMSSIELPGGVAAKCVALTRRLALEFSGIDLRFTDDDRVVCFEVNPSPAYIAYEAVTGQPIAAALARHLADRYRPGAGSG